MDLAVRVHSSSYLLVLERACTQGAHLDMDTYTTPESWQLAWNAAGGGTAVAAAVWKGDARRGFALTRPPGHHATKTRGMGFCLMNNIALAAEYLLTCPLGSARSPSRLAIVDLDLHHGNGTQEIFYQRRDVLFISTHQSPFYPGSGRLEERGSGEGFGYTANIPFPRNTGDKGFRAAMDEIILPLLDRFRPEMLLVSIGFDTHWRDPLGSLIMSAAGLGALIGSLAQFADQNCSGKIALFLEGGYDLGVARACGLASAAALLGIQSEDSLGPPPYEEGSGWKDVLSQAKSLWFS